MAAVLVVYDTTEGQTQRIADKLVELATAAGHEARTAPSRTPVPAGEALDGLVLAASIHAGHHSATARLFVLNHKELLARVPSAFVSVSLSAADPAKQDEARGYVAAFLAETGWQPTATEIVAGKLAYTRYGFLKRWMMKSIAGKGGLPTDTSQDYEYTDWSAVERFASTFFGGLPRGEPAPLEPVPG